MTFFDERRASLKNSLHKGDFERGREKINDNLTIISSNLKDLMEYSLKIGSKKDGKVQMEKIDKIIVKTGEAFSETYTFIKDLAEFKYNSRPEKIENIKKAKNYEEQANKFKERFDDVVTKIKRQDLQIIESARNSFRISNIQKDDIAGMKNSGNIQQQTNVFFMNGREYLDGVEEKEKQVNLILKVTTQLHDMSVQTAQIVQKSGQTIQGIEENVHSTGKNIDSAVSEIKEAKEITTSSGGMLDKAVYLVLAIVVILILMSWIMPK